MRVLLLDIVAPVSLAVTRSLGKAGHSVAGTCHEESPQPAQRSRYFKHVYKTSPPRHLSRYMADLREILVQNGFDFVVPLSEPTVKAVLESNRESSLLGRMLIPGETACRIALSKSNTVEFARELGIRVPQSFYPSSIQEVRSIASAVDKYPVVIKGELGGHLNRIRYANSPNELIDKYAGMIRRFPPQTGAWPMIQEFIQGRGAGYFGLFRDGEEKAFFMHERVWEFPSTGGPSSIAKSIYNADLRGLGRRLLGGLQWNGLGMVEFKQDVETEEFVLMEINPRPWGSMALPISLGIDFPKWLVELGAGVRESFDNEYEPNRYFAWLLPNCLLNLVAQPGRLASLLRILAKHRCRTEIEPGDIRPLWSQFRHALHQLRVLMQPGKSLRFPQGSVVP